MNQKQAKVVQSRLTRKEVSITLQEIKTYVAQTRPGVEEFEEAELSTIVDELLLSSNPQSQSLAVNGELPVDEIVPVDEVTKSAMSVAQKQELITQVATALDVSLSVTQVQEISQKMNWAMSDRTNVKQRIQAAIVAWIDYQTDQDLRQTNEMMQAVEGHLATKLQESNQHFSNKAQQLSTRVGQAVEQFRATETEVLSFFQIPG